MIFELRFTFNVPNILFFKSVLFTFAPRITNIMVWGEEVFKSILMKGVNKGINYLSYSP